MGKLDNLPDLTEIAKEKFYKDQYAHTLTGIEIVEARENYAKCILKIQNKHLNLSGHVMGGVIFTLADFTFGVAANTKVENTITVSANIDYISVLKGEYLFAETKIRKKGKKLSFYQVLIRDENKNKIAEIQIVGYHINS